VRVSRLRGWLDGWDLFLAAAAGMLFAGLTLRFDVGLALIVVGTLGLVLGVVGARGAEVGALLDAKRKS